MTVHVYNILEKRFNNLPCNNDNIVVEIGSERGHGSTEWLCNWANKKGMDFHTVDVVDTARQSSTNSNINFHVVESGSQWCQQVLPTLNKKIKVLYLDNFDYIHPQWENNLPDFVKEQIASYARRGVVMNNENSEQEHRLQTLYCLPYMDQESIIIMDDTGLDMNLVRQGVPGAQCWGGKCATAIPLMVENNFRIENIRDIGNFAYRSLDGRCTASDELYQTL